MEKVQIAVALAKLYSGTKPGDDMWNELDYLAVEYAVGCPVERIEQNNYEIEDES